MDVSIKNIRWRDFIVVLLGDITVFFGFIFIGKNEHGLIQSGAFVRTGIPFAVIWLAISPWLGAYKASSVYCFRDMVWRIPLTWILCGMTALMARSLLTDRGFEPTFALVAIAVQGTLLVGWRGTFMILSSSFSRSS